MIFRVQVDLKKDWGLATHGDEENDSLAKRRVAERAA